MQCSQLNEAILSSETFSVFDRSLKPLLLETYQRLYNKSGLCKTCPSSYQEAYLIIKRDLINNTMAEKKLPVTPQTESKISFKNKFKGHSIQVKGYMGVITEENISQELIDQFPDLMEFIEK